MMELTDVAIAGLVAAFLSLVLEVVPGVADLWEKVDKKYKSLVVLVVSLLVPPAIVGLSCLGVDVGFGSVCPDPANPQLWVDAVLLGLAAFFASQVTFEYASASLGARVKKA
jgi:drug/metabolite transporter (DMT)-like permease